MNKEDSPETGFVISASLSNEVENSQAHEMLCKLDLKYLFSNQDHSSELSCNC